MLKVDDASTLPARPSERATLFINHNFAQLWWGQILSVVGDAVFNTTLTLWIAVLIAKGQPWGPLAVGGLGLATNIPTFTVGSVAGVFVDRWDKRKTLLWMDVFRSILVLFLLLATGGIPSLFGLKRTMPLFLLGIIYLVVFLTSSCTQFFNQARMILISDIVEESHLVRASALLYGTAGLALVIGPPLAAPVFFQLGVSWALFFDALSFVPSFATIFFMRVPHTKKDTLSKKQSTFFREFREGIQFFTSNRVLMVAITSIMLFVVGEATFNVLNVFFVPQNLQTPVNLYGFIVTAFGIGALIGTAIASSVIERTGVIRFLLLALTLWGGIAIMLARQTCFLPALITYFFLGFPYAGVNIVLGPLLLQLAPRRLVGRITSVFIVYMGIVWTLSTTLASFLESTVLRNFHMSALGIIFGPIDTIFTLVGILGIVGGILIVILLRPLP